MSEENKLDDEPRKKLAWLENKLAERQRAYDEGFRVGSQKAPTYKENQELRTMLEKAEEQVARWEQVWSGLNENGAQLSSLNKPLAVAAFCELRRIEVEKLRNALGLLTTLAPKMEIERLRNELERERLRLAACGVVALADTPESAINARAMHDDYKSASCDDVARRVDECMRLRAELAAAKALLREIKDQCRMADMMQWPNKLYSCLCAALGDKE